MARVGVGDDNSGDSSTPAFASSPVLASTIGSSSPKPGESTLISAASTICSTEIAAEVVGRWVESHGEDAVRDWRAEALQLAEWCADAWRVSVEGFLPGGSLSCVLAGMRTTGAPVVLKLLAPWAVAAIASEARALGAWDGMRGRGSGVDG